MANKYLNVYAENINPMAPRIDCLAAGLYVRTSGFTFSSTDNSTSYQGDQNSNFAGLPRRELFCSSSGNLYGYSSS